jgi:hypothetical protein
VAIFRDFLNRSTSFYVDLISQLCQRYNLVRVDKLVMAALGPKATRLSGAQSSPPQQNGDETRDWDSVRTKATLSCHKALICLGDIGTV